MPVMTYQARSTDGRNVAGHIEASSPGEAIRRLRQSGVQVVSIRRGGGLRLAVASRVKISGGGRVKQKDILQLLAQLQLMIQAGTGLEDALQVLFESATNDCLRRAIEDIRERVKGGESFSQALGAHPRVFDMVTVRMIAAAEASGTLASMLGTIHELKVRQADVRRSVAMALAYPAVLLTVAMGALCVLFIWVLPKFAQVFAEVGAELPGVTRAVLGFSQFVGAHKIILAGAIVTLLVGGRALLALATVKYRLLRLLLRLPIIGQLIRHSNTARSLRLMGTLWRSGLPITEVTRMTSDTMRNPLYREFFDQLRQRLIDGKRIISSFAASDLFPPTVAPLIRTGEETGGTPTVLDALATYHEKETAALIKTMITLLEPAIIVLMAGGVGLVAVSVVVPLFRLSSAVH